jgi:hypothetical protein
MLEPLKSKIALCAYIRWIQDQGYVKIEGILQQRPAADAMWSPPRRCTGTLNSIGYAEQMYHLYATHLEFRLRRVKT